MRGSNGYGGKFGDEEASMLWFDGIISCYWLLLLALSPSTCYIYLPQNRRGNARDLQALCLIIWSRALVVVQWGWKLVSTLSMHNSLDIRIFISTNKDLKGTAINAKVKLMTINVS